MHTLVRKLIAVAVLAACLISVDPPNAGAALAPLIAGNATGDSVFVTVSVNDTLGNAADADTIVVIWAHRGEVIDSTVITGPGFRRGQYHFSHVASDSGKLGQYQVMVRARVQGRSPITNYAYHVMPGGVMNLSAIGDSNLARSVTAEDYKADLSACGGGYGAIPCTLYTMQATGVDTTVLGGIFLRLYNSDESATVAYGTTDANGRLIVNLAADTFHVYGFQMGFIFAPQPGIIGVGLTGSTDTLWATAFDPGAPATIDLCRVYGWVGGLSGSTPTGATVHTRVTQSPLRHHNRIISPYELTATADSVGYWYLDLIPSSTLTPDTTRYEFTIRLSSGAIFRRTLAVPDSTQWLLTW